MSAASDDSALRSDARVPDGTELYRRVSPQMVKETPDGGLRVSSVAFQNTSGTEEMSVVLGDSLAAEGREPASALAGCKGFGLVSLTAGFVRGEEQAVRRSPNPGEPAHGDVVGKKAPGRRKRFAAAATWAVAP